MKKKILSLLTAFAMVFGIMAAPFASAADNTAEPANQQANTVTVPTGTLENDQLSPTKPDVTEIDLYKLTTKENYHKGAPWEHTGGKIADTKTLGKDVQALAGAKFTFYKINGANDVENEKILALLNQNKSKFETVEDMNKLLTGGSGVTGLTASDKDASMTSIDAGKLELATGDGLTQGQTAATDVQGKTTIKLADGYYWAIESVKPDKVTGQLAVPFGLTLPLVNGKDVGNVRAGTQYLKKLYIYPKNIQTNEVKIDKNHATYNAQKKKWYDKDGNEIQASDLGAKYEQYQKDKKEISSQLGEERRYDSMTEIPRNYTFTEFSWSDIMSEGLTYKKGSLKVTITYVDEKGEKQEDKEFIDLTKTPNKANAGLVTENNNGFNIHVVKEGVKDLTQPNTYTNSEKTAVSKLIEHLKNGPVTFKFSYSATVNNNTVVDKPQSNSITFEPGEPDGGGKVKSKDGKVKIEKTWTKAGVAVTEPTATEITYYLLNAQNETIASVTVKKTMSEGTKIDAGKGITFVVGKTFGSGEFQGLPNTETEYKVREAVAGYKPTYNEGKTDAATDGNLKIENKDKPEVKKPTEPKIVFHGKKFVKMDQIGDKTRLFGAEFVVKNNSKDDTNPDKGKFLVAKHADQMVEEIQAVKTAKKALDDKISEYNKLSAEEQKKQKVTYEGAIATLQQAYNDAVIAQRTKFTWEEGTGVDKKTPPANAYKLVSDGVGRFEITGLSADNYQLIEVKAPAGYALRETPVDFEVKDGTYAGNQANEMKYTPDNLDEHNIKAKDGYGKRVDNKKVTIPQTGGIGSLIFIVAGLAIMTGAFVAYKRSQAVEA